MYIAFEIFIILNLITGRLICTPPPKCLISRRFKRKTKKTILPQRHLQWFQSSELDLDLPIPFKWPMRGIEIEIAETRENHLTASLQVLMRFSIRHLLAHLTV